MWFIRYVLCIETTKEHITAGSWMIELLVPHPVSMIKGMALLGEHVVLVFIGLI